MEAFFTTVLAPKARSLLLAAQRLVAYAPHATHTELLAALGGLLLLSWALRLLSSVLRSALAPCLRKKHWKAGDWAVVTGASDVSAMLTWASPPQCALPSCASSFSLSLSLSLLAALCNCTS
jgi:hypothetical protein